VPRFYLEVDKHEPSSKSSTARAGVIPVNDLNLIFRSISLILMKLVINLAIVVFDETY
jgi:hypothetical protein